MSNGIFGKKLRSWREKKGLSQRQLDDALGLGKRSFINNLESGATKPPLDKAVCYLLGAALDEPGQLVWDAACREHLARLPSELRSWLDEQLTGADTELTPAERELIAYARQVDQQTRDPDGFCFAEHLRSLLLALVVDLRDPSLTTRGAAAAVVARLRALDNMSSNQQRGLARAMVALVDLVAPSAEP